MVWLYYWFKKEQIFSTDDIEVEIIDDHETANDGTKLLQLVISDIKSEDLQIDKDQKQLISDANFNQSETSRKEFDQLESINNDSDKSESINNDSDQSESIDNDSDKSESLNNNSGQSELGSEDVTETSEEDIFETTVDIVETTNNNSSDKIIDSVGDKARNVKAISENDHTKSAGNSLRRVRKKKRRRKQDAPCSVSRNF